MHSVRIIDIMMCNIMPSSIMLNVVKLSFIMLIVVILSFIVVIFILIPSVTITVIMFCVGMQHFIFLSVFMLTVVAPNEMNKCSTNS
jgi:hypothetical protein